MTVSRGITTRPIRPDAQNVTLPILYRQIYIPDVQTLFRLVESNTCRGISQNNTHGPTSHLSYTKEIILHPTLFATGPGGLDSVGLLESTLKATSRLEAVSTLNGALSLMPPAVFLTLLQHVGCRLKRLVGYALHAGSTDSETYVQQLASLSKLEDLCTGPLWLPSPSETSAELGSIAQTDLFPCLRSITTSFFAHSHLQQRLLHSVLPALRSIRIASWEYAAVLQFLQVHGHKLKHVDISHEYGQYFRSPSRGQERDIIDEILDLCPNLTSLALHSLSGIEVLCRSTRGHGTLSRIHLSTSSTTSLWRLPELEVSPTSFPFFPQSAGQLLTHVLVTPGWEHRFPHVREISIYGSDAADHPERRIMLEVYRSVLVHKGIDLAIL